VVVNLKFFQRSVTSCRMLDMYQCFRGTRSLHHDGNFISIMEAAVYTGTSLNI